MAERSALFAQLALVQEPADQSANHHSLLAVAVVLQLEQSVFHLGCHLTVAVEHCLGLAELQPQPVHLAGQLLRPPP